MGKTANKITSANFKPSEGDGRFQVYSKQFNDLVDVVGENQQLLSTQILNSGGGTLDQAYDNGGAGLGRTIVADTGAVKIEGADGLLVTGLFGTGAVPEWVGGGAYDVGMFFNPLKGAFRAGLVEGDEWDDVNVGDGSVAIGANGVASGFVSLAIGNNIKSKSATETVLGSFNTDYTPISTTEWEVLDRLFGIGNGTDVGLESDAFIVLKNGKITCPSTTGSFTPNVLTTAQRDALTATAGMLIYNSTTDKLQCYDGTIWNDLF